MTTKFAPERTQTVGKSGEAGPQDSGSARLLNGGHYKIPLLGQKKIDGLAMRIDGTVQLLPLPFHRDIGLIHTLARERPVTSGDETPLRVSDYT